MGPLRHVEDHELLLRISRGEAHAFDAFYERYWKFVFNTAFKRIDDVDAAKDISQEVFSQLWSNLRTGQGAQIENLQAYLYVAVRNQVFKWMERERRFVPVADVLEMLERYGDATDAALLFDELLDAYRLFLVRLPPQQRTIFKMRYEEEMTSAEIALHLQVSEKTVRNQLGRVIGKMKNQIIPLLLLFAATAYH